MSKAGSERGLFGSGSAASCRTHNIGQHTLYLIRQKSRELFHYERERQVPDAGCLVGLRRSLARSPHPIPPMNFINLHDYICRKIAAKHELTHTHTRLYTSEYLFSACAPSTDTLELRGLGKKCPDSIRHRCTTSFFKRRTAKVFFQFKCVVAHNFNYLFKHSS
jgi:hypothetical protein